MTASEFNKLLVGDICEVQKGKDKGIKCVVLYKYQTPVYKFKGVLVKPLNPDDRFTSNRVTERFVKLFPHIELKVLIGQKGENYDGTARS